MTKEYLNIYPKRLKNYEIIKKYKGKAGTTEFLCKMKPKKPTEKEFVFVKGIIFDNDRKYPIYENEVINFIISNL